MEAVHPGTLFIELTSHCNMHCTFCPSDLLARPKKHMDDAVFQDFLCQVRGLGISAPVLLNVLGEPLLNKEIFRYLDLLKEYGLPVTLITNMTLLADMETVSRLLGHANLTLALSLQTPNRRAFRMRGYDRIRFKDYFRIPWRVIEEKFRLKSHTRLEMHISSNWVVAHDPTIQSDYDLRFWENFSSEKAEKRWVNTLLAKLDRFAAAISAKYRDAVAVERDLALAKYRDHIPGRLAITRQSLPESFPHLKGEDFWGYMFLPNVLLQFKSLEPWTRDRRFLESMLPKESLLLVEERDAPLACSMTGNLGLLADGQLIFCCLDYEAEMKLGNLRDRPLKQLLSSQDRRRLLGNAMIQPVCRRCKGNVFVFSTRPSRRKMQAIDKFGQGFEAYETDLAGIGGRWTNGRARAYVFARRDFSRIRVDFLSHFPAATRFTLGISAYDRQADSFRPEFSEQFSGSPEQPDSFAIAFDFIRSRLYRIEINSPTFVPDELFQNKDRRSLGIAVFRILLVA